jgi:hypothetical protein
MSTFGPLAFGENEVGAQGSTAPTGRARLARPRDAGPRTLAARTFQTRRSYRTPLLHWQPSFARHALLWRRARNRVPALATPSATSAPMSAVQDVVPRRPEFRWKLHKVSHLQFRGVQVRSDIVLIRCIRLLSDSCGVWRTGYSFRPGLLLQFSHWFGVIGRVA